MGRGSYYKKWQANKSFIIEPGKLKEKETIFSFFPYANFYGFQSFDIRKLVSADTIARFARMTDKNVLFPVGVHSLGKSSFLESKSLNNALDDKIPDTFFNQMKELGIGICDSKKMNLRNDEYVELVQRLFIELFNKKYITYNRAEVLQAEDGSYYDSLNAPDEISTKSSSKVFSLNIEDIIDDVINDINKLKLDSETKNQLLSYLEPKTTYTIEAMVSNGEILNIELENLEYLGALTYVLLNPEYIDIGRYISSDEYQSIFNYLENGNTMFVFSGLTLTNPLTGSDVPIFISTSNNKGVYLGIPGVDDQDKEVAKEYELEIIEVIENNTFINSDFLDGLTLLEGKEKIKEVFIENGIAKADTKYTKNKIMLSSKSGLGVLYPFLYDKEAKRLNDLSLYLPYKLSNQFRPVLNIDVETPGVEIQGSINNLFIEGILPILSIIYDNSSTLDKVLDLDNKEEYESWLPISHVFVDKTRLQFQLFMPIVLFSLFKKELNMNIDLYKNIHIINQVNDPIDNLISRENNNLIDFNKLLNNYYSDSIRLYTLLYPNNRNFNFNKYELDDLDKFVKDLEKSLLDIKLVNTNKLDFFFYDYASDCKILINQGNLYEYVKKIENFTNLYLLNEEVTEKQLLIYLETIFPIMPYLAEEIYEKRLDGRYSIINEGWNE